MINTELQDLRTYFFMDLEAELRRTMDRFASHRVRTLVLDTNDLLHYVRFDKIPWQRLFGPDTSVMITHVVIDEIDEKSYDTNNTGVRMRARAVFALLEWCSPRSRRMAERSSTTGRPSWTSPGTGPGTCGCRTTTTRSSRACYLQQAIALAPVTVVTGDNGVGARALSWGLKARVLD
ncbi:PIN domain-containing protein [Streptomyces sp. NPDC088921]|uniref:PIN domain-containing protein n=1 Tax=unclassified Streptomyces TaxID=2593676 RepID=UPI00343E7BF9